MYRARRSRVWILRILKILENHEFNEFEILQFFIVSNVKLYFYLRPAFIYNESLQNVHVGVSIKHATITSIIL